MLRTRHGVLERSNEDDKSRANIWAVFGADE